MDSQYMGAGGTGNDTNPPSPVADQDMFEWSFNHAAVPRSITLPTGEVRVNNAFCEMLGYAPEELRDEATWAGLTHPDDLALTQRQIDAVLSGEKAEAHFEKRYVRKDGSAVWTELYASLRRDAEGTPLYFTTTIIDINETKRAEEILRESEARLRLALGAAHCGVWEWDVLTDESRWSEELWGLYGLDRESFDESYDSWLQSIRPEDRDRLAAVVAESLRRGEPISIEWRVNGEGDSPPRWLLSQGQPFKNDAGVVELYRGIVVDITERRLSEQHLRDLLDNAPYGAHMYELDEDDRLIFVGANAKAEEILGLDHAPLFGKTLEDAFPGNAGTETATAYHRVAALGGTWETEQYAYDAQGIAGVFEVYAFSFGPRRMAVFFRDITEKRKLEEELLRTSQTLQAAMDNSPAGIAIADAPDGKLRYVNDAGLLIGGGDRQSLVDGVDLDAYVASWNILDLDGSPLEASEVPLARAIMFGETGSREFVIERAAGDARTVVANAAPIRNEAGRVVSGIVVFSDITELKAAEEHVKRLNRVYAVLSNVNQALVHLREPELIFDKACHVIVEDGGFTMAWVGMVAEDGIHVEPVAWAGAAEGYLASVDIVVGDVVRGAGPTGRAISEQQHVVCPDIDQDPSMATWKDNASERGYRSCASFPLVLGELCVGAFTIYASEPDFFDEEQIKLLDELADDISFSLHVAEREVQRALAEERVARSLAAITEVVGRVAETRDPYTAGHQRRVAELAVAISNELDMSAEQVEEIRVAALLHDIGKMSVPTEILSKPGKLSTIEFDLIKGHSEAGYRIIASADIENPIAEIVYQHHERCDGSGYPRGLTSDQILPAAKVLMVADVVEAMMSHRPYRAALGADAAFAEINRGLGSQYDTEVGLAAARVFAEGGFEFSAN